MFSDIVGGGGEIVPFLAGPRGFGQKAWQLVRLLAQRLQAVQLNPVIKGEVIGQDSFSLFTVTTSNRAS